MKTILLATIFVISTAAHAETKVLCSQTDNGVIQELTQENENMFYQETEAGGNLLSRTLIDANRTDTWDGHLTGLITAPGFSLTYQNNFGCIVNVSMTVLKNRTLDPAFGTIMKRLAFTSCVGMSQNHMCGN